MLSCSCTRAAAALISRRPMLFWGEHVVTSESTSGLEEFWSQLSTRGKVVTAGVVFLLLGILAGFFDLAWAIGLILIGVIILLIGLSVMRPKSPVVVNQPPFVGQMPPAAAYYPPAGYYPPPAGYSPPSS